MPQGLEVYNDGHTLQIGIDAPNYVMAASGLAPLVANGTAGYVSFQFGNSVSKVTYNGNANSNPLLVVMPTTGKMAFILRSVSGTTWTWDFGGTAPAGGNMAYWVFDKPGAAPAAAAGFATWDASGALIFATNFQPMRLTDLVDISSEGGYSPTAMNLTKNYTAGRKYGLCFIRYTGAKYWWPGNPLGNYNLRSSAMAGQGGAGGVSFASWLHSQGPNSTTQDPTQTFTANGQIMVVDVTGLPNA